MRDSPIDHVTGGDGMRIHFTKRDLARTYLADDPDPLWELVNSLQGLQSRYDPAGLGRWRRQAAGDLRRAGLSPLVRTRLFAVAPHAAYFPDLLTPAESALGLDAGIETILCTPRRRLAAEFGRLPGRPGAGSWLDDLRAGRASAVSALGDSLRTYQRAAIAPYWDLLRVRAHHDLAVRRQILREGGIERLLDSFRPLMRWRNPVLEFTRHPSTRELHLGGRGVRLVPSCFARLNPGTIFDAELPQVIVYPIRHDADWLAAARPSELPLTRLIGETRAAVLCAVADGCTTTELARRADISLASASRHAAVLRAAGLLSTVRSGTCVVHTITPSGNALVAGPRPEGGRTAPRPPH